MAGLKERFNNIKNLKKDWKTIQNNPYSHQKFMFNAYKWIIILVGCMVAYQVIKMIINSPSSGNNSMSILTRAFMALVGVMIIFKIYGMYNTMKVNLTQYESNPTKVDNYLNENNIDTNKEIDDILNKYGNKEAIK